MGNALKLISGMNQDTSRDTYKEVQGILEPLKESYVEKIANESNINLW